MENKPIYFNGRRVVGFRDAVIDELDTLLFSLADSYTVLCEDDVLSACLHRMHSRLEEISPSCMGSAPIGDVICLYLEDVKSPVGV